MTGPLADPALSDLITLGLHHEQQHQELILTDIKHAFFSNPLLPAYCDDKVRARAEEPLDGVFIPGGVSWIGHDGPKNGKNGFCFDNELPRHQVLLKPFRIATRPASNGEYRAFIADGGYERADMWLSDGWAAVQAGGWKHPVYWLAPEDPRAPADGWQVFGLHGPRPLDAQAPVSSLSFYEAAAYAEWAGARLPTEFEWEAAFGAPGITQMTGHAWQWTRSSYDPYPGFQPFAGAVGEYNGKFMVGQMVLRGGSAATPQGHTRPSYRNFFPPAARWQFTGLRLAGLNAC
jgi:ergothioneine biosynthesis protein EgtB